MAQLLDYHRREAKPAWWAYFERLEMDEEELWHDSEAIAELDDDGCPATCPTASVAVDRSYTLALPARRSTRSVRASAVDPATEKGVDVERVDDADAASIEIRRATEPRRRAAAAALIPGTPVQRRAEQRKALRRLGADVAARGVDASGKYRAARDVLQRTPPRRGRQAASCRTAAFDLEQSEAGRRRAATTATCSSRARPARARPTPART